MSNFMNILVVDDEPDVEELIRQRYRREIRKEAIAFTFASDGLDALDKIGGGMAIDIVLSDINMPRMDGLTLLSELSEQHPNIKTVVVSAYGDMANLRTAMNRGAFDFLTKPIDFADLDATIQKTFKQLQQDRSVNEQWAAAERAKASLSKYFSPKVATALAEGKAGVDLGGERREASFMFTDLAGFTRLVETTEPDVIIDILNGYLDGVAKVIFRHEGTLMKVIGDAVQAIFNAPVDQPDHAERAVACALDIDQFAEVYRAEWVKKGIELGVTRIGLHGGEAVIGNFGGDTFFDYTAYGDAVNVAARLEAANKVLNTRILVSDVIADQIGDFVGRPAGRLRLSGKAEPQMVFEPMRSDDEQLPAMEDYRSAYYTLASGQPEAKIAFAELMSKLPDDPLTNLHLQRVLAGAKDDIVEAYK